MREFPELEGVIGAEYARLAGHPDAVCRAIAEHYLPDGADAPLPETDAGRVLSAADKIDTLTVSFSLGHRPTGSRDPYGLRRAAIGLCRLAVEGGLTIPHDLLSPEVREFVEERLEGYLDVPVEFVRAARPLARQLDVGAVADLARFLAGQDLAAVHEVYTRVGPHRRRRRSTMAGRRRAARWSPPSRSWREAVRAQPEPGASAEELSRVGGRRSRRWSRQFFDDVLVMDPDERVKANRLRLVRDVRDAVGRLGDLSEIPL